MLDKVFLGQRVQDLEIGAEWAEITRVNLLVDSEHRYTAGDDSGRAIEKTCPWGSQAMCDSILARLKGVRYRPFTGESGLLDPAAEVGDGITVGGVYSVLAQTDIAFDALCAARVCAPGIDEVEDEYPYKPRARRQTDRELARVRSTIRKTAEEITLLVEDTERSLSSEFSVKLDSITSRVTGLDGKVSSIQQYVDSITLEVANGSTSSSITLKSGSATIASQTIQMNGLVTFTGLSSGTTTINGACIKTGTIDANRLNLTGAITFRDLSSAVQNDINDAYAMAEDAYADAAQVSRSVENIVNGTYYNGTFIDGDSIYSPKIYGGKFYGNEFSVIAGNYGGFNIYANVESSRYCMFQISYENAIAPMVYLSSPAGATLYFEGTVSFQYANVIGL